MTEDDRQPLAEEAALRQLEELHREIERTRLRRKDANEAFDRFLRSFDRPSAPPPVSEPEPRRPPMPPPPAGIVRPAPLPSRPVEPPPPAQLPPPPPSERVFAPPPVPESVIAPPPSAEPVFAAPKVPAPESTHEDEIVTLLSPDPTDRLPRFRSEETVPLAVHSAEPPQPVDLRALEATPPRSTDESLSLDEWEEHSEPTVTTAAFPAEAEIAKLGARKPAAPREARSVPVALTVPVARAVPRVPPAIAVLAIVVIGAIAFFLWRGSSDDAGSTEPSAPEAAAAQPQPAAAPATAPVAKPQAPPFAELSTVRPAWVRVVVDGRKVIERELPAGSRVPIEPGSQIVVRAGDAGAVRVAIGGKDQGVVGADGQVATKTYTVAAKDIR